MKSAGVVLCVFTLAWGLSSAGLTCYYCKGKGSECPEIATDADFPMKTVPCPGALEAVCVKYSVDLLNGDAYTVRNCAPSSLDEYGDSGIDFCSFVESLYDPLVTEKLIEKRTCSVCNTVECNT